LPVEEEVDAGVAEDVDAVDGGAPGEVDGVDAVGEGAWGVVARAGERSGALLSVALTGARGDATGCGCPTGDTVGVVAPGRWERAVSGSGGTGTECNANGPGGGGAPLWAACCAASACMDAWSSVPGVAPTDHGMAAAPGSMGLYAFGEYTSMGCCTASGAPNMP
jgi:hypothetical protein